MQYKHIVIFSDSLGRPRPDIATEEATRIDDVYGSMLKKHYCGEKDVELLYVESLDTDDAIFWSQRMVAFREPDLVIFQIGINDCAPRLFKKKSGSLLLKPWFQKITHNVGVRFLSRYRYFFTKLRPSVYVKKDRYISNLREMCSEISKYSPRCDFVFLTIANVSPSLNERSYNYSENIRSYNEALLATFPNVIKVEPVSGESILIGDGVHLTKKYHAQLAEILIEKIRSMENMKDRG
jgi:lysophospholipase L1-like esterase